MRKYIVLMGLLAGCAYTPDFRNRVQPAVFYEAPQPVGVDNDLTDNIPPHVDENIIEPTP